MNRFTIQPKSPSYDDTAVILLHAGCKAGKKPYALRYFNKEYLVNKQIARANAQWPGIEIILVVGCESKSVLSIINQPVKVVENERYAQTSSSRSALMGMRATLSSRVFIVYGDIIDIPTLTKENYNYIVGGKCGNVGIIDSGGLVTNMSYGLPDQLQWSGIIQLTQSGIESFKKNYGPGLLFYEVINRMIESGTDIRVKNYGS